MPSITSHGVQEYFAHASNAFWWIVGEALGFRRGGPNMDQPWPHQFDTKPSKIIIEQLEHTSAPVLTYQQQVEVLTEAGFALWDVVAECTIKNSDDNSVRDSKPNNIRDFVEKQHPSVRKIVFASGKTSAKIFVKLNKEWLKNGKFVTGDGEYSSEVFSNIIVKDGNKEAAAASESYPIKLLVPFSVSPAAAAISFQAKKEQWLSLVFSDS